MDIRLIKIKDVDIWAFQHRKDSDWETYKTFLNEKEAKTYYEVQKLNMGLNKSSEIIVIDKVVE